MQQENKRKLFTLDFTAVLILSVLTVFLLSLPVSAAETETEHTVSGQEPPDEIHVQDQEERKDDQSSSIGSHEVHNAESEPVSGMDDNFNLEENEMIISLLERLDKLIELLTPEENESAAFNNEDIMYPDGYQNWPYPVRVRFRMLTSYGYTTEDVIDCVSPEEFEESFRRKVQSISDGALQNFSIRYVLSLDENSVEGKLIYDYENPVYLSTDEEPENDEEKKELSFEDFFSDVKLIDEKLSELQEDNRQLTVSGNDFISNLDDTIQKGNEENRQTITDLFTQGITYILAFIGIVVGSILGVILSRYLKHD